MAVTRTVAVSRIPSPLGEMIDVLSDEAEMTGGTVSVMNLALSTA